MFIWADAGQDKVVSSESLPHQFEIGCWTSVDVCPGLRFWFALLNDRTGPMGRIICALTGSPYYHVAIEINGLEPAECTFEATAAIGLPYDWEGALSSWKETGYHTPREEFCSGLAYEVAVKVKSGLTRYPNPGRLYRDLVPGVGMSAPHIVLSDADAEWLRSIPTDKVSTGTREEAEAYLFAEKETLA